MTAERGDVRKRAEVIASGASWVFSRAIYRGTHRGGPFEVVLLDVFVVDDDGLLIAGDVFGEDQEDAARARVGELEARAS